MVYVGAPGLRRLYQLLSRREVAGYTAALVVAAALAGAGALARLRFGRRAFHAWTGETPAQTRAAA